MNKRECGPRCEEMKNEVSASFVFCMWWLCECCGLNVYGEEEEVLGEMSVGELIEGGKVEVAGREVLVFPLHG